MKKATEQNKKTKMNRALSASRKIKASMKVDSINEASMLLEMIKSRRSIRFFKKNSIPDRYLMMILEGARWAPSPANSQPWEFFVIKDKKIQKNLMNTMKKVGKAVREQYPMFPWGRTSHDSELIWKAPAILCVCADYNKEELRKYDILSFNHKKEIVLSSIAAAIQNIMLMATALGLGSLWMTPLYTDEIKRLLRIPETLELIALVPLGYPVKARIKKTERRDLKKLFYQEDFIKKK